MDIDFKRKLSLKEKVGGEISEVDFDRTHR